MDRKDKIKLLNELKAGRITLQDLAPIKGMSFELVENTDTYREKDTGEIRTLTKIKEYENLAEKRDERLNFSDIPHVTSIYILCCSSKLPKTIIIPGQD